MVYVRPVSISACLTIPSAEPTYVALSNTSASLAIAVSILSLDNIPVVSVSKLIKYCLKKYPEQTYSSIVAFVLSSVVLIIYPLLNVSASITELIVGIVLLLMGSILTYKMEG